MTRVASLYTALIRTHHITSRKKLQKVRKAAAHFALPFVLVRSGGSPGIMYAEGADEAGVTGWVSAVQNLRYKDFQCVQKPAPARLEPPARPDDGAAGGFREVASVAEFGERMRQRGLESWWKVGMGYEAAN
ncbi:hypothetical protein GGR56DRAFT_26459 [Xylariaceae sp. FL0804]|nr:hypothetical protein GGR56DRAFT_26459 [Xylariaceae sp. FL0804]